MPDVKETPLPGTGVRHDYETGSGGRIGVLLHRSGVRDLLIYGPDDPDACIASVRLGADDTATLVELLGGSQVSEAVGAALRQRIEGLAIDWVSVDPGSAAAGHSIADSAIRAQTGASVVAVVRGETAHPSPGPDLVLEPGDTVVAVGTDEGIRALTDLLSA